MTTSDAQTNAEWLELAVEVDHEAVESVTELFARYGFNEGVVVEEPFTQDPDGDNLTVDLSRPVTVRTFVAAADAPSSILEEITTALWHLGRMRPIGELKVESRREEDWANAWKEHYRPVRAGRRVVVRPPWQDYAAVEGDVVVVLDPGMAFGTGTHPTTRLCLTALEDWIEAGDTVFDVGTGSGILAIAAALLGASHVDAVDIEPVAVRQAAENLDRNDVTGCVRIAEGSADAAASPGGAYDLVLANIIARILIEIATDLVAAVKPGGTLILSGIIEPKEAGVLETFRGLGLELRGREQMEDWVAQVWTRPGS
ncbi:MAG TPA: 50S ribosomal protein L11 methyltransferase [Thermomicrobiales bacterium]|nr:50S ribosomal protein L11 methyltransferase [Thermomicrobiales bacterium]